MAPSLNVRQRTRLGALLLVALLFVALTTATGCPAVYPELGTRLRAPAPGQVLDPPPPEDMRWIKFLSGNVPERTRDGRTWGAGAGSLPDPYARLLLNGKEVLRTNPQSDTLEPTWPGSPAGNFVVKPEDHLRVEVWDSNALNDKPIGIRDFRPSADQVSLGRVPIELEGGARVEIAFEPAHAQVGLGLWYELRTSSVYITRTSPSGPAERAGIQRDDEILAIAGREVRKMTANQVRSAFNAVPLTGIVLLLKHPAGSTETVTVTEGPIYPTFEQVGPLP